MKTELVPGTFQSFHVSFGNRLYECTKTFPSLREALTEATDRIRSLKASDIFEMDWDSISKYVESSKKYECTDDWCIPSAGGTESSIWYVTSSGINQIQVTLLENGQYFAQYRVESSHAMDESTACQTMRMAGWEVRELLPFYICVECRKVFAPDDFQKPGWVGWTGGWHCPKCQADTPEAWAVSKAEVEKLLYA